MKFAQKACMNSAKQKAPNRRKFGLALLVMGTWRTGLTFAQQTTLYDIPPPINSAYVRIVWGSANHAFDVSVNKKKRLFDVQPNTPSEYMILPAGPHTVNVQSGRSAHTIAVDAKPSEFITVMLFENGQKTKINIFEDKISSNRFKASLSVYHLGGVPSVDITTVDGKTPIFSDVAAGSSTSIIVNPISLIYVTRGFDNKEIIASDSLEMRSGKAYSIFVYKDKSGRSQAKVFVNAVERYQN